MLKEDDVTPRFKESLWEETTNSSGHVVHDCISLSPSDESGDLLSQETEFLIFKLKAAVFIPVLYLFGGPANVASIIVFYKHGLKDRVNLCLCTLSVVDFVYLTFFFLMYSEQMFIFTSDTKYGPVFAFFMNNTMLVFYNLLYSSMFMAAVIAVERSICVLFPLRAKVLLKTKRMAVFLGINIPLTGFLRLVVTAKYVVVCAVNIKTNMTFMTVTITEHGVINQGLLGLIDGVLYGFGISVGCPFVVLIATLVTSIKLRQTVTWRKLTSTADSRKEMVVTKMLVILSIEFLIFSLPSVFVTILPLFDAGFSANGKYQHFFIACISFAEISLNAGSSFNFLVYYLIGSRYRKTFHSLFSSKQVPSKSLKFSKLCDEVGGEMTSEVCADMHSTLH